VLADCWQAAGQRSDRLTDLVRRKLARHGESEVALATLATHPDDPASIQALAAALSAIAAVDEAFQIELAELVDQAKQDPTIGAFATHVEGLANVGQIVNLAQVRDVHFHLPGSATLTPSPAPIRHTWAGAAQDTAPLATNTQGERRPQSEPPTGDLPTVEEDLRALKELRPLLDEAVYLKFQERMLFRRFPHLES